MSPIRGHPRGALPFALLLVLLTRTCPADDVWYAPRGMPRFETVEQLADATTELRRRSWALYSSDYSKEPDSRGRTLQSDIDQWLMSKPVASKLEALTTKARAQELAQEGDTRRTLAQAAVLVEQESYRTFVLNKYWSLRTAADAHRRNLEALQARLQRDDPGARRARIAAALDIFARQVPVAMAAADKDIAQQDAARVKFNAAAAEAFRAYNEERGALAVAVSAQERAAGKPPVSRAREIPCPDAATETSGKTVPASLSGLESAAKYYPAGAKHLQFEGVIMLEVAVSAEGCIQQASVYESSGVAELDDGSLTWALQAAGIKPAEKDGRPAAGSTLFRFRFTLNQ